MKWPYFIVGLILIAETAFRIPYVDETLTPFPLNKTVEITTSNYLYYGFEHVKVILLVTILYIVNTRYFFLIGLFSIDLIWYLLHYDSTVIAISGFPVGVDLLKVFTLVVIVLYDAGVYRFFNSRLTDAWPHDLAQMAAREKSRQLSRRSNQQSR